MYSYSAFWKGCQDSSSYQNLVREYPLTMIELKTPGPDVLHSKILKELGDGLVTPLSLITWEIFKNGASIKWLKEDKCPYLENGDGEGTGNNRPVNLTSMPVKILEQIIKRGDALPLCDVFSFILNSYTEQRTASHGQNGFSKSSFMSFGRSIQNSRYIFFLNTNWLNTS